MTPDAAWPVAGTDVIEERGRFVVVTEELTMTGGEVLDVRSRLLRPQPIGLFDGPAGLLVVADGEGTADLLRALASGVVPARWPDVAAHLDAARRGDVPGALGCLGAGPEGAVNRFVLAPSPEHLAAAVGAAHDDPLLRAVVEAAAYASGLRDVPPSGSGLDGEFAVLALTTQAARALERGDRTESSRLLRDALAEARGAGVVLHARVLAMLAEQRAGSPEALEEAARLYGEAASLLTGSDVAELRGDVQLERGIVLHQLADGQRHLLVEAIRCYQSALLTIDETADPERFALASMNVAVAILELPMTQASDQVRLGVAVQSLRAALRVYRPGDHPHEWSSCQMNLANALQYLPSTHREENLREAVELYEEVLSVRSPATDPPGCARVLANQANALAHLGAFVDATARYGRARVLFQAVADLDAVASIDRQVAEIEKVAP